MDNDEPRLVWLHGWPRSGTTGILIGTATHCIGCGRFTGTTTIAIDDDYIDWAQDRPKPDWPFPEDACPVCDLVSKLAKSEPPSWPRGKPRPLP
jgi:hypothetical protein